MQIQGAIPAIPTSTDFSTLVKGHGERSFGEVLQGAVEQVDKLQTNAAGRIEELLAGGSQDVHSAMIAVQQANLSFELMVQVRNKMVNAYQEISRLQF